MLDSVWMKRDVLDRLLAEARANADIECCGLLAGRGGVISTILPAKNALESAKAYEIAPNELFTLFRRMREEGLEHLGIYHSHPKGDNSPSPRDIECAFYPEAIYVIICPRPDAGSPIRAFRIIEGHTSEVSLQFI
jgi:proteasome lid subunit RPN8/RPN11